MKVYDFNEITGSTHKRAGIDEIVDDAQKRGVVGICTISSGNYVREILDEVERRGLQGRLSVVNLVNPEYVGTDQRTIELEIPFGRVLRDNKEREEFVRLSLDSPCVHVRDYTDFISRSLVVHAQRILQDNPDYVGLGVGAGKLFVVIAREIRRNGLRTKLVGFVPQGENGIFNDDNLYEKEGKLYYCRYIPKSSADKLSAPYTSFKPEILDLLRQGHELIEVREDSLIQANELAKERGYNSEVSGSAGFILEDSLIRKRLRIGKNSRTKIINTGDGKNTKEDLWRVIPFADWKAVLPLPRTC